MKRYSIHIIIHIVCIVASGIGCYLLLMHQLWFSAVIAGILFFTISLHLYTMQMKLAGIMLRFTESIRHNDMMQTFQPPYRNRMTDRLAGELGATLTVFRNRLLEEEVRHQYYENR